MSNKDDGLCPCGTSKLYEVCCRRFLVGGLDAKTPEQLMRSRYTAFSLGGFGDYLLDTWFPPMAHGLDSITLSQKTSEWLQLQVLSKTQEGDQGTVEFIAHYKEGDGRKCVMQENSVFTRIKGRWYYVGSDVDS